MHSFPCYNKLNESKTRQLANSTLLSIYILYNLIFCLPDDKVSMNSYYH